MTQSPPVTLVSALSGARKAFSLYPATHPEHRAALTALIEAAVAVTAAGPFTLNLHLGRLYDGSTVLPSDVPGLRSVAQCLESHDVESLTFHPVFSEHDAVSLVEVLALRPTPDLDVAAALAERGTSGVVAQRLAHDDESEADARQEQRAMDHALYQRLVGALKRMTAQIGAAGSPALGEAGTIVEGILERFMDDSAAILGLATMHDQTEDDLFHAINTMIYSLTIGMGIGIPPEGLTSLGIAALLHDIGKAPFNRNDPRDREQARAMHPRVGAEILARLPDCDRSAMLVAYEHHMRPDGQGWPEAEAGYVPHPYSRMVSIADRYDRLTGGSHGSDALTPDRAVVQILRETRDALDSMYARVFVREMGVFPVGCLVRLSDQSVGVVCAPGEDPLQPRVRMVYAPDGLEMAAEADIDLAGSELHIVEVVEPADLAETVSDHL
jgi:HD-GYP domain-containing protein (c-di-GMP phosphodiesterase class II)